MRSAYRRVIDYNNNYLRECK